MPPRRRHSRDGGAREPRAKLGLSYWEEVRRRFEAGDEGDQKFHEVMIKDAETTSSIGVLIMPLAFAGLTTMPYEDANGHTLSSSKQSHEQIAVRIMYTICLTLAISLSSLGTLSAMRTSLMLSAQPPAKALELLVEVDNLRWAAARSMYPFRAIRLAIRWLLVAVVLIVEANYGIEEALLACVVLSVMYSLWMHEDAIHTIVQKCTLRLE